MTRILVLDNYDSFVYNLVQYLGQLGAEVLVRRNDAVRPAELDGARDLTFRSHGAPSSRQAHGCPPDPASQVGALTRHAHATRAPAGCSGLRRHVHGSPAADSSWQGGVGAPGILGGVCAGLS